MNSKRVSPFDNEEAADFAEEILKTREIGIVAEAIYAVPDEDWDYVEHGTATRALVAAEMIADQMGHESGDVPDELHSWIHEFGDGDDLLIARAKRAVERVLRNSQTRELLCESPLFREWTMRTKNLIDRLQWR